jgi:ABC-type dipeptide/oligopeptide/nickel transport system permease subunit
MKNLFKFLMKNNSLWIGALVLSFFILVALGALVWTPFSYREIFEQASLLGPTEKFFLGTDDLGRDLLSRLMVGAQLSLGIGVLVGGISILIGASLGIMAGFFSGRFDRMVTQVMNALQAMPSLLLALFVVAILGPSIINTIISVTLVSIPIMYRLVRTSAMIETQKDYIVSAKALGAGAPRIILKHLLPNCLTPILVQSAVCCSEAILNTAALGFLGLGIPAPFPEWGTMLSDSKNFMETAPRLLWAPGLCLMFLILSTQLISDGLRDQLDPKLRGRG